MHPALDVSQQRLVAIPGRLSRVHGAGDVPASGADVVVLQRQDAELNVSPEQFAGRVLVLRPSSLAQVVHDLPERGRRLGVLQTSRVRVQLRAEVSRHEVGRVQVAYRAGSQHRLVMRDQRQHRRIDSGQQRAPPECEHVVVALVAELGRVELGRDEKAGGRVLAASRSLQGAPQHVRQARAELQVVLAGFAQQQMRVQLLDYAGRRRGVQPVHSSQDLDQAMRRVQLASYQR